MTTTSYEKDVVAWAREQAALLRSGNFSALDIAHIAEEIEDVGKSEQRELASRMTVLLAHLLKWQFQPLFGGNSWSQTIKVQRKGIHRAIEATPSLKTSLESQSWLEGAWDDAVALAMKETGISNFPEFCPWSMDEVLTESWLPADAAQ